MESYTDSFVTRGLLDKEPKPVAIIWVGGWRSSNVDGSQEDGGPAGVGCTSPSMGRCGKRGIYGTLLGTRTPPSGTCYCRCCKLKLFPDQGCPEVWMHFLHSLYALKAQAMCISQNKPPLAVLGIYVDVAFLS